MAATSKRTLREWRAYLKYSKQGIASIIGIHPSTYAKWEANPETIRVVDVIRISKALECEADEIIFFEGKPSFKLGSSKTATM